MTDVSRLKLHCTDQLLHDRIEIAVSIMILQGVVISATPNPQPGGPGFVRRGFPPLNQRLQFFKGTGHLRHCRSAVKSIRRDYDSKDGRQRMSLTVPVLCGRALFSIGDTCQPQAHWDPGIATSTPTIHFNDHFLYLSGIRFRLSSQPY